MSDELERQQTYSWARSVNYADYNAVLGYYQAQACLEHKRGKTALDLACGDGLLTQMLLPGFERIVGVDASATHLDKARQRLPQVTFQQGLIEDVELAEKFDTVFLLMILEHVQDPIFTLQRAARHLKPNGVLIAHVPNAQAINRRIAVSMGTLTSCEELSPFDIDIAGHRRSYTLATLVADFERADLKVQRTGGVFYKMLSTPQIDWFLKNGLWQSGFGWGRVGGPQKDWKAEFCRACYDIGKERPEDCNVIFAVATPRP